MLFRSDAGGAEETEEAGKGDAELAEEEKKAAKEAEAARIAAETEEAGKRAAELAVAEKKEAKEVAGALIAA